MYENESFQFAAQEPKELDLLGSLKDLNILDQYPGPTRVGPAGQLERYLYSRLVFRAHKGGTCWSAGKIFIFQTSIQGPQGWDLPVSWKDLYILDQYPGPSRVGPAGQLERSLYFRLVSRDHKGGTCWSAGKIFIFQASIQGPQGWDMLVLVSWKDLYILGQYPGPTRVGLLVSWKDLYILGQYPGPTRVGPAGQLDKSENPHQNKGIPSSHLIKCWGGRGGWSTFNQNI